MIVGEPDNKKILFFQEIAKRIHLHSNCEKIKFLGQFGVISALRVMPPFDLFGSHDASNLCYKGLPSKVQQTVV